MGDDDVYDDDGSDKEYDEDDFCSYEDEESSVDIEVAASSGTNASPGARSASSGVSFCLSATGSAAGYANTKASSGSANLDIGNSCCKEEKDENGIGDRDAAMAVVASDGDVAFPPVTQAPLEA